MTYPTSSSASDVWSLRDVYKAEAGDDWPFPAPTAPTTVTAEAGDGEATVTFSGQVTYGDSPTFTVTSSPGGITATGSSPVTVTGLTNDTEYTFTVTVTDNGGQTATSSASNAVTPEAPTHGGNYAASYLTTTGGNLITVSSGDDLRAAIDGASDGDAILVGEGTYALGPAIGGATLHSGKNVLIAGKTNSPQNVVIDFDHDTNTSVRDHPVFDITSSSTYTQIAFLTFFRNPTTTISTNYNSSLMKGGSGTVYGIAANVYFDLDDKLVAWHYDNNGNTAHDIRFIRCTFANYSSWTASYSGRDDVIDVGSCLFDGGTDTTEYVNLGGNITNASINLGSRTYSTSTYPTAGHLYVPNTTAVF